MATKTVIYVRKDEKKHSVTYIPESNSPQDDVLGQIYVKKQSGFTSARRLRITVEEFPEDK
jgi:hypothetical protein